MKYTKLWNTMNIFKNFGIINTVIKHYHDKMIKIDADVVNEIMTWFVFVIENVMYNHVHSPEEMIGWLNKYYFSSRGSKKSSPTLVPKYGVLDLVAYAATKSSGYSMF